MELAGEVRVETIDDGVTAIELVGEHDLGTAPDLRDGLANAAASGSAILIDLGQTTFVDSSILGAILEARRGASENGRAFAVAREGSAEAVSRVLEVTGLSTELPVHASREAAIKSLESQRQP